METMSPEEFARRMARDMKDRAEATRRAEKANRGKARAERQAKLLAQAELGYGSW